MALRLTTAVYGRALATSLGGIARSATRSGSRSARASSLDVGDDEYDRFFKSALVDVVRTAADGTTVLEAKGVQSAATLPFAALRQLLAGDPVSV